jgi:hypothetical protein
MGIVLKKEPLLRIQGRIKAIKGWRTFQEPNLVAKIGQEEG